MLAEDDLSMATSGHRKNGDCNYNLKKYLKFDHKIVNNMVKEAKNLCLDFLSEIWLILSALNRVKTLSINSRFQITNNFI
jgi:hypothetical protein